MPRLEQVTIIKRWLGKRSSAHHQEPQQPTRQPTPQATHQPTPQEPVESLFVTAENEYGRYAVPRSSAHRTAARMVIAGEVYEPDTIALIRRECGQGDVVHAGTFFGDFLPGLSSGLAPGARVHAFEPNPDSYECARTTLELNQIDNVSLHWLGLGPESGRGDLITINAQGVPRGGASRIVREGETVLGGSVTVEVPIDSIDARVPADRTVSVLQLDVEGHEEAALSGAVHTIERCRPLIILESVPEEWVAAHLAPLGYRAAERVHHNTVFRIP